MSNEAENNNTFEAANALSLGSPLTAKLKSKSDVDYFKFTTPSAGLFSISLEGFGKYTYNNTHRITFYDSDEKEIAQYGIATDLEVSLNAQVAGTYYAKVEMWDRWNTLNSNEYTITAKEKAGSGINFETEANNSFNTADDLKLGTPIQAEMTPNADIDWYKFNAPGSGNLSIDIGILGYSHEYWSVSVYNSERQKLITYIPVDKSGWKISARGVPEAPTDPSIGIPSEGTYYIEVKGPNYQLAENRKEYSLNAILDETSETYERESNNSIRTASDVTLDNPIKGQLSTPHDEDYYKFTIPSKGELSLALQTSGKLAYAQIETHRLILFDTGETKIAEYEIYDSLEGSIGITEPGTYYAKISRVSGSDAPDLNDINQYRFTASFNGESSIEFESESNGSIDTANNLTLGSPIKGRLTDRSDDDYYRISISEPSELSIVFNTPTNNGLYNYFKVSISEYRNNKLASYLTGMNLTEQISIAEAGTYYVKIEDDFFHDPGEYSLTATTSPVGSTGRELELNDSFATANTITFAAPIKAQLATPTDVDYFTFSASQGGVLSINFDTPKNYYTSNYSFSPTHKFTLYDSNSNSLGQYSTSEDLTISAGIAKAGRYYIGVSSVGRQYDSGEYALSVILTTGNQASFELESNNTVGTANNLTLGTSLQGQLLTNSDIDYYKFNATEAGSLLLDVRAFEESLFSDTIQVTLYDSKNRPLGSHTTGRSLMESLGIPEAGEYFIKVFTASDSYYKNLSSRYSISASLTAGQASKFESESNNSISTADALVLGRLSKGQLSNVSDIDYYKFTISESRALSIDFKAPSATGGFPHLSDTFRFSIYDSGRNLLETFTTDKDFTASTTIALAGTYYAKVSVPGYYHNSSQYALLLNVLTEEQAGKEQEPNNIFPNILSSGSVIAGIIEDKDDFDTYSLVTTSPGTLEINFQSQNGGLNLSNFYVSVFDPTGYMLANREIGQNNVFNVINNTSGKFTVKISPTENLSTRDYSLTVTSTKVETDREIESNNNLALATVLQPDKEMSGNLMIKSDKDYYKVAMDSSGKLSVNFNGPTDSQTYNYYRVEVVDDSENVIATRDTGSDTSFDAEIPITGTYYLKVSNPHNTYIDSDYIISANVTLFDPVPDNAVKGTMGEDLLVGTSKIDLIYGLGGNDEINGLGGNDTVVFRTEKKNIDINTIAGLTVVKGKFSAGEHAYSTTRIWNIENLKTRLETNNLAVSSVDPIFGTTGDDVFNGSASDDVLDGKGGEDFIDGKAGIDTLALFGQKKSFNVVTVEGITRISSVSDNDEYSNHIIKTINIENLGFNADESQVLPTTDSVKVFGSIYNDSISGTSSDEVFDGAGGIDVIDGQAGSDTVVIFGAIKDYIISFPEKNGTSLTVTGKSGGTASGQQVTAKNVEKISFIDRMVEVVNPPSLIFTPSTIFIGEGGNNSAAQISLSVRPITPVKINIFSDSQISVNKTTLTFDTTNWNIPQEISITAIDDLLFEKSHTGSLNISFDSKSDYLFTDIEDENFNFLIQDNDSKNFGTILGRLWSDRDSNKVLDEGELALSGWTVFIDANSNGIFDTGEQQTQSGVSGWYLFEGIVPGTYTIAAETKNGWSPTFPSSQNSEVTLVSNTTTNGIATTGDWGGYSAPLSVFGKSSAELPYVNLGRSTRIQDYLADGRFNSQQGEGYAVAVIDTGADLKHRDFADRIVFQYDFSGANDGDATDYFGHGTHVSGTIVSDNGDYPGIAPKADLVVLKVFPDSGSGAADRDIVEALDWVIRNHEAYNIVAVNMSLGSGEFHNRTQFNSRYSSQLKALANSGVVVVAASGNSYGDYSYKGVGYPSSDAFSLSVGATFAREGPSGGWTEDNQLVIRPEIQQGVVDSIAQFSQRGPLSDVFAPGVWINASWLDGGHKPISGTSMASPQVAGMVLLLQELAESALGRRLNFFEIKDLLSSTGKTIYDGDDENDSVRNTGEYYKAADMFSLGEAVLALKPAASHTVSVIAGETSSPKDFGFIANEAVRASSSDDFVVGSKFSDVVYGGTGDDRLQGGNGDDMLYGQEGDDYLSGGNGDDVLDGGLGDDTLSGGMGNDTAVFDTKRDDCTVTATAGGLLVSSSATGIDTIAGCEFLQFTDQTIIVANLELSQIVYGTSGDDYFVGKSGQDDFDGGDGNDTFSGNGGGDVIQGGEGIDLVTYTEPSEGFVISKSSEQMSVSSGAYTDVLSGIERLQFSDTHIALDLDGHAGETIKLLDSLLGGDMAVDKTYLGIGLSLLDGGMDYKDLMKLGLEVVLGPNPTGTSVVRIMYENLVGSEPENSILEKYGEMIDSGTLDPIEIADVFAGLGLNSSNVDLVGLATTGVEFIPVV